MAALSIAMTLRNIFYACPQWLSLCCRPAFDLTSTEMVPEHRPIIMFGISAKGAFSLFHQVQSLPILKKIGSCEMLVMHLFKTAAEHVEHLKKVLQLLRDHEIYLKPSRCVWGQTELAYLGHIVSHEGLKPDLEKVQGRPGLATTH